VAGGEGAKGGEGRKTKGGGGEIVQKRGGEEGWKRVWWIEQGEEERGLEREGSNGGERSVGKNGTDGRRGG